MQEDFAVMLLKGLLGRRCAKVAQSGANDLPAACTHRSCCRALEEGWEILVCDLGLSVLYLYTGV